MASADSSTPLGLEASHGKTVLFPMNPPDLHPRLRTDLGLPSPMPGYPPGCALYPVPVRQLHLLPPASFRSHLTMDTLALS